MSLTYQGSKVAQIDTVTIGGAIEVGDAYSVTVAGTTISFTAVSGDTQTSVVNTLISRLNASNPIASVVTAAAGATAGTIALTADTAGNAFTTSTSATNGGATADNTASVTTPTANSNGLTDSGTGITTITFDGSGNVISPTAPLSFSIT